MSFGNAVVKDDAYVGGLSGVMDNAIISENAVLDGDDVVVSGNAIICGDAHILHSAQVTGYVTVKGSVQVLEDAFLEAPHRFLFKGSNDLSIDDDYDVFCELNRVVIDGRLIIGS